MVNRSGFQCSGEYREKHIVPIHSSDSGEEALVTPVGVSGSAVTCRLYIKNNNNNYNNNNHHNHNNNHNNNINISKNYTNKYNNIHDRSNNENCQEKQEEKINRENHESFCRLQLRDVSSKQDKHYFKPPIPVKYKVNAQDISKYFDYPKVQQVQDALNEIIESKGISDDCNKSLDENSLNNMGSNLSRHHGKGLTAGRRTQSSGNLCDPKGKIASHVSKMFVPCSNSSTQERYKFSGSLPNNLDNDKDAFIKNLSDNNNVISDTISGNLGGTLPYKKSHYEVPYYDKSTVNFDLVKYRSQSSLEGDPWEYHQNSKVDLVRCKHGNYSIVPKNQHADTISGTMEPAEGRYEPVYPSNNRVCSHHNGTDYPTDFTMGTLPKRRIDPKWCDPASIQTIPLPSRDSENPDRVDRNFLTKELQAPKPPARLDQIKYQTPERSNSTELKKTSRPVGCEHQADQGYASERSPEEEHLPSLAEPFVFDANPENTFRVTLQKTSRGLGLSVSGGGTAGPIRVKRLFPQQPAALSNKLQPGDILLAANGIPLSDLTNYEALEVLRTTSSTVELLVCRLPGETSITPPGAPPTPPARREPLPQPRIFNPVPPLHIEPCGEFDIEMTKVGGSLGFTLRKVDSSALGHYVRALVREPALSDGRIQPGDKIVAVDGAPLSPMSHEEAVALLRQCGPKVKLRLYRDLAQTPVSALSPTESDHPLRPPRTSLRKEAVDMLCDLAIRKLSPNVSDGSQPVNNPQNAPSSSSSPRRLRRPPSRTTLLDEKSDNNDQSLTNESLEEKFHTNHDNASIDHDIHEVDCVSNSMKLSRPKVLNVMASNEKSELQKTLKDSEYQETNANDNVNACRMNLNGRIDYYECHERNMLFNDMQDNNLPSEPVSMPPIVSFTQTTNDDTFSYKNPAYQSVNPTCSKNDNDNGKAKDKTSSYSSDQNIAGKIPSAEDPVGCKSLLKWKGVMFAPDDKTDNGENFKERENSRNNNFLPKENIHREDCEIFMVELTRGWNSRLGFSLQPTPDNKSTIISMVHPDSVAAKDGRLKQGDILVMINDESVENTPTSEIIDLLRKIRGSIGITVARKKNQKTDKSLEKV
ncbi:uncharacterized protein [Chelonus insularis]|uniref:uncharacterized protein isoform X2 n=1 Tax=Chelonus insularis TaxID=460826 RepID=UPI00158B6CAC|nr:uncharacterized protein LOC118072342 isoform X2 [Chelonus insularis]